LCSVVEFLNQNVLPKMEKTTTPAMMLVAKSKKLIASV
jgi:hypothetical protein